MKTAIITGASSGLGREFALALDKWFPDIERVWLVSRRGDRMYELSSQISAYTEVVEADLTSGDGLRVLADKLRSESPETALLVNCAGRGFLGAFDSSDIREQILMIELNISALTAVTHMVLPYMPDGARIINVSSIASFAPNANMAVYSSTKAYVSSFSRALGLELRPRGISVTAVCPGPMSTEFITLGRIDGRSKMFETLPYCKPAEVAAGAYRSSIKRRAVYTNRFFYKLYRVLSSILPHALVCRLART